MIGFRFPWIPAMARGWSHSASEISLESFESLKDEPFPSPLGVWFWLRGGGGGGSGDAFKLRPEPALKQRKSNISTKRRILADLNYKI